ncbi:MAG: zinc ribbon domain-containing protein [Clostridia bacterium]|nr:zinc ribbon domain-containing protein [Clostridia bacterium]
MSACPKCGRKLRIFDISQFCPACGVNMRFVNFEENFLREAKLAELSQAGLKVKLRNLKYSFMGSKWITAKLVVMLLPLLSLLIPSGNFSVFMPFLTNEAHFGILGFVNAFTNGTVMYVLGMTGSELEGFAFAALRNAVIGYVVIALCAVFCVVFSLFGFASIRNMQKGATIFAGLGIVASIADMVLIAVFANTVKESLLVSGSFGFGLIVTVLMFGAVFFVNLMLWKNGIHPVYDEGVEERVAIYKKVKAGEINIDDLPQPVVETEETRKIDAAIAAEEAAFRQQFSMEAGKEDAQ